MSNITYPQKTINGVKKSIHRLTMEEHLGRELSTEEHVYHLNGDQNDNHIDNLVVVKKKYNRPIKQRSKKNIHVLMQSIDNLEKRVQQLEDNEKFYRESNQSSS